MANFTLGETYRAPPPLFPTPFLQLITFFEPTPLLDFTLLRADPSLSQNGHFYAKKKDPFVLVENGIGASCSSIPILCRVLKS